MQWQQRKIETVSRNNDVRSEYNRDKARVLHSAAFRCLQGKTQIHTIGENDFYRSRLTHSLEVAQIGTSIVNTIYNLIDNNANTDWYERFGGAKALQKILPDNSLMETLCYAHDIGHPPFGHGGESALNFKMQNYGFFEGNAQTFRILTKLEPYSEFNGMNLTRRTLLGILKYPRLLTEDDQNPLALKPIENINSIKINQWRPAKGLYQHDLDNYEWVMQELSTNDKELISEVVIEDGVTGVTRKTKYKSLDCSIMELADDIAYAVHDLEDAIAVRMVDLTIKPEIAKIFASAPDFADNKDICDQLFSNKIFERKNIIGSLVNYFISNVELKFLPQFNCNLLAVNATLSANAKNLLDKLKYIVWIHVINEVKTQRIEHKGQQMIVTMFDIFLNEPKRLLPRNIVQNFDQLNQSEQARLVCDYIASMSDARARRIFNEL